MKLIIFDMDQTLVDFLSTHNEATRKLFRHYFNVDAGLTEIDYSGRSLFDSFQTIAVFKQIPQSEFTEKKPLLMESYESYFGKSLPEDPEKYIMPGVRDLLEQLSKSNHVVVLYTGDSQGIVDHIMQATGLGRYFRLFFYGTEVAARSDMVKEAITQAGKLMGKEFRDKDIVIIGDSIRDVECGKLFNALTIAVATGTHTIQELLEEGADYVFPNLSSHHEVLNIIG